MLANIVQYRAKHVGVCPPARGAVIDELVRAHPAPVWLVVAGDTRLAEQLAEDIAFFGKASAGIFPRSKPGAAPAVLPDIHILPESAPDAPGTGGAFASGADRLRVLSALRAFSPAGQPAAASPKNAIVVATPLALLQPVPAPAQLAAAEITLARGQVFPFKALVEKLRDLDYDSEAVCEAPGSYAVRGGIIDVYPITATQPCRLDFFGDEIEDIRVFDPVTQRSAGAVGGITICASPRVKLAPSETGIADYLPPGTHILIVEPAAFEKMARAASPCEPPTGGRDASATPAGGPPFPAAQPSAFAALFSSASALFGVSDLDEASELFDAPGVSETVWETDSLAHHRGYPGDGLIASERLQAEEDARARFLKQVATWARDGCALTIITAREGEESRAREILAGEPAFKKIRPRHLVGALNEGFRITRRPGFIFVTAPEHSAPAHSAPAPAHPAPSEISNPKSQIPAPAPAHSAPAPAHPAPSEISNPKSQIPAPAPGHPAPSEISNPKSQIPVPAPEASAPEHSAPEQPAPPNPPSEIFVTETELFGRQRARRPGATATQRRALVQRAQVDQLLDFSELVEGDFVVHLQHGIALYRGLSKIDHAAGAREVISLEFDDGIILHVPLQESHLVSRYVGLARTRPQLGRIGAGRWEKTRRAAEASALDLAASLLHTQAAREARPGLAFSADTAWQKEFESSFPFTETPGQLRAISETKADMERPRPMDRLICGDVGFGKTEVAIRAAFKAVQDNRQVALLAPTTVLSQQHLNTFRERTAGYPVIVEMLSRFRTRGEQNKIIAATAAGRVDILIGTHRLLQRDIAFRDLGLVIIDEEQRFGVKHKERLKSLRATVDVLSMSATPIPRTLHLALTGARDMSVIETAPTDRRPVQTIVKSHDEKLIIEAVRHELSRGGQVFYLHNRVQTIDYAATRLREILPGVRIGVGHGQMHEKELERVMTDFVAGKHDMLVCTTIIESGLDIPNCNTIIIEGADRFGLSQLYQLRGRVGRFKHQAHAYLLLRRHAHLVEIARQRLNALRAHNQPGAGFRIAMRDLELRGAGNLLGSQQSGHIAGVGFELYCQLLRQSVARLKGDKNASSIRAGVKLDFVRMCEADAPGSAGGPPAGLSGMAGPTTPSKHRLAARAAQPAQTHATSYTAIKAAEDTSGGAAPVAPIQARIPAAYISETRLRIDTYRRLALAENPGALARIESDLRDRFGKFGAEVRALFLTTEIRLRAERKNIISVETDGARLKCLRNTGRRDDFVMHGARFPRLAAATPLARLKEIITFLDNLPEK